MSEHDCTTTPTNELTAEKLRELLHYDPDTGKLTWKVRAANRVQIGDTAGSKNSQGYLQVTMQNRKLKAHRLVWLHVYGEWPKGQIDHINQDKTDNRLANLRDVTQKQNLQNKGKYQVNTSGHTGVHWHKRLGKWQSAIAHHRKIIHLGYFTNIEDAVAARKAAEKLYWSDTWIADTATV